MSTHKQCLIANAAKDCHNNVTRENSNRHKQMEMNIFIEDVHIEMCLPQIAAFCVAQFSSLGQTNEARNFG